MNIPVKSLAIAALLMSSAPQAEQTKLTQQAAIKIKAFASELKTALKANIEQGGLKQGIEVCKSLANPIAKKHSTDGWQLKRTSLKLRNSANVPDAWEQEQLSAFEQQKRQGADVSKLVATTMENGNFRLIKAIATGEVCLKCHGKNISPEVKSLLKQHYPNDLATGFELGDIRGAFSVMKKIKQQP